MSDSGRGFNVSGSSTLAIPSLRRADIDKYEKGKLMSIDLLDKSLAAKLEAHGYLRDKSNLMFYLSLIHI